MKKLSALKLQRKSAGILLILIMFKVVSLPAVTYEVGSGMPYENISEVPWDSLEAGDSVLIHHRDSAYHEKWVICRMGTYAAPIVIRGIPDEFGNLPVISGREAVTPPRLNFWNENRGVIKIGGANIPPDGMPAYIIIENLDIKSARPPYSYTGSSGVDYYINNASAIYIEKGEHIIIRNCTFRDCGNGFFCAYQTSDLVVEGCYIVNNGNVGRMYEHNNYTEAFGILFQFNHLDSLRTGCMGNNLKDRSAGCIIRYNWIEDGNRQLDLVDTDYEEFYSDSIYNKTYVYGNILVENEGEENSQIIQYGGDSGAEERYRKGTLFLYNNTIVSTRSDNTTLVKLSSDGETCDARNNIIYTTVSGSYLAILDDAGTIDLRRNWLRTGWVNSHSHGTEAVNDFGNVEGIDPGFSDFGSQNYTLSESSPCINAGAELNPEVLPENIPAMHYIRHCLSEPRPVDDTLDIGAYEYLTGFLVDETIMPDKFDILCYPNPFNAVVHVKIAGERTDCLSTIASAKGDNLSLQVEIYDINGRLGDSWARGLVGGAKCPGFPDSRVAGYPDQASVTGRNACLYTWQPSPSTPSGIYFIKVRARNETTVDRVIYFK